MRHLIAVALVALATPAVAGPIAPSSPTPTPLIVTGQPWDGTYVDVEVEEDDLGRAVSPDLADLPRWHLAPGQALRGPKAKLHIFNQTKQPVKVYLKEKGAKPIDRIAPNQWSHMPLELGSYHLRAESPGRAFGPVKVVINPDFETTLMMK